MRWGVNDVIPVAMKRVPFQVHSVKFLIRHIPSGRVFPTIQTAGHLEPFGSRRASDQVYDRLIISKRFTAPIRGAVCKYCGNEYMLDKEELHIVQEKN